MKKAKWALAATVVVLVVAGCAAGGKVLISYTVPPRIDVPSDVQRIAVGMIDYRGHGNYGEYTANSIAEGIMQQQAKLGIDRFEVIDRQHVANLLEEQRLQLSGLTEANVSEYAKLANADVFLVGSISTQVETQQDTVPEQYPDFSGGKFQMKTRYVPRTIRRGSASLTVTMYDAASRVVASQSYTASFNTAQDKRYKTRFLESEAASGKRVPSEGEVVDMCINDVVAEFLKDILPYDVLVTVNLKTDGPRVNQGVAYARADLFDEAASEFAAALEERPSDHAAAYNLGVMREKQGDLDGALESYTRAFKLRTDSTTYSGAVKRVKVRMGR